MDGNAGLDKVTRAGGDAARTVLPMHQRQGFFVSSEFVVGASILSVVLVVLWFKFMPRQWRDVPMPESTSADTHEGSARRRRRFVEGMAGGIITEQSLDEVAPPPPRDERTIHTRYGDVRVTIEGSDDPHATVFVTYHDVGVNHNICFNGFFQIAGAKGRFRKTRAIHIDAPGHEDGAGPLSRPFPTLDQLGEQVGDVLRQLEVTNMVIGFGVGAGVNVLLRYAGQNPGSMFALVSVGGCSSRCGIAEWINWTTIEVAMDIWGISPFVQRCFANLNLSPPSRHRSMYGDYCDAVASIPKETTEAFVRAYRGRSALPEAAVSELRRIPMIMFAGGRVGNIWPVVPGWNPERMAIDMYQVADVKKSTWVKIRSAGQLVSYEEPWEMFRPIELFLNTLIPS